MADDEPLRRKPHGFWREAFGGTFVAFAVAAVVAGIAVYVLEGGPVFVDTLRGDVALLGYLLPKLGAALLIAGFVTALIPPDLLGRWLGENSGISGMALATVAGAATPGGPMTSFPILVVLKDGGVGRAPLVTYVTAWTTMGLQRVLIWEVPLMGLEFAAVRFVASIPLGFISGALSRVVPIQPRLKED